MGLFIWELCPEVMATQARRNGNGNSDGNSNGNGNSDGNSDGNGKYHSLGELHRRSARDSDCTHPREGTERISTVPRHAEALRVAVPPCQSSSQRRNPH